MEAKKLSFIEKLELKAMLPEIPKTKRKHFKIIRRSEYDLMKKTIARQESYLQQLREQFNIIEEKDAKINDLEKRRRKNASKIGGLKKALNKIKNDI